MVKRRLEKILSGVAGEYFVAGELSRRGYLASITLRNTRDIDILVASADASRSVAIQVKTNQGNKPEWVLTKKVEQLNDPGIFYIFVNLNGVAEKPIFPRCPISNCCQALSSQSQKVAFRYKARRKAS